MVKEGHEFKDALCVDDPLPEVPMKVEEDAKPFEEVKEMPPSEVAANVAGEMKVERRRSRSRELEHVINRGAMQSNFVKIRGIPPFCKENDI